MSSRRGFGGQAAPWRDSKPHSRELQKAPGWGDHNRSREELVCEPQRIMRGRSFREDTIPPYHQQGPRHQQEHHLPYGEPRRQQDYGAPYEELRHRHDYDTPYEEPRHRHDYDAPYGKPRHQQDYDTPYGKPWHQQDYDTPFGKPSHRQDYDAPYGEPRHQQDYDAPYGEPRYQKDHDAPYGEPRRRLDYDAQYGEPRHQQDYDAPYGEPMRRHDYNAPKGEPRHQKGNLKPFAAPRHQQDYDEYALPSVGARPPPPKQAPPPLHSCRDEPDRERRRTPRNNNAEPGYLRGHDRGLGSSSGEIPTPPPAPVIRPQQKMHSSGTLREEPHRGIRGRTSGEGSSELRRQRGIDRSRSRDEMLTPPTTPAFSHRNRSKNERIRETRGSFIDLTSPERGGSPGVELLDELGHDRAHASRGLRGGTPPPPKQIPPPPPAYLDTGSNFSRDEPPRSHRKDILGSQHLRRKDERTPPPPALDIQGQTSTEETISSKPETRRKRGRAHSPISRRKTPSPSIPPKRSSSKTLVHTKDELTSERMSISPFSEQGEGCINWPRELGYDEALAMLWNDENFANLPVNEHQGNPTAYELINEPYDPSVAVGAHHRNTYLLMKNDIMILGNKYVENMIHTAGQIWSRVFRVEPPLIRVPETPSEYVYFKMHSIEDKDKVLSMYQNDWLEKTQFMGRPTYVKDVCVAPLPILLAQPGTRQEALDALLPMRDISYNDQVSARADLIIKMLKDVVQKARESLNCLQDSDEGMAHCFYNKPDLKDLVRMGKLAGYSRFNTIDLGYYHGEPAPGVRVYYGPDDAPKAFLLPLKDCSHISTAIIETTDELFRFLIKKGFAIHDPWNCQGNLVKFRVMMNSLGRMIVTVELTVDDEFVESFEPVVRHDNPNRMLMGGRRPMYPPVEQPSIIPGYGFMRENSLEEVPPTRTLIKSGGLEQLKRIRPVLEEFHQNYGQRLGVSGIFVTWYFVNERPVEWDRNSKIWHHVCGSDFIKEVIMDVPLCIYPNLSCPHFPHTQAFPKILQEIVAITGVNSKSRVIVLSEYFFLAEFFGLKCSRTIFMKTEVTEKEITYLARTLPKEGIKFLSPLDEKREIEDLEPGGDIVIIWGGVRSDELLRSIAFAGYRRVIFVRDGLKRVKHDKADTFVALHHISKCLFPYMALAGAIAIDVEPHSYTMPALLTVFTRAPNAPKVPLLVAKQTTPSSSKVPEEIIPRATSNQPGYGAGCPPQPELMPYSELKNLPTQSSSLLDFHPHLGNAEINPESAFPTILRTDYDPELQPQVSPVGSTSMNPEFGFPQPEGRPTQMFLERGHDSPYDDGNHYYSPNQSADVAMESERELRPRYLLPGDARRMHGCPPPDRFQSTLARGDVERGHSVHEHFSSPYVMEPDCDLRPRDLPPGNARGMPTRSPPGRFRSRSPPLEIPQWERPQDPVFGNTRREPDIGLNPEGFPPQMAKFGRKRGPSRFAPRSPSPLSTPPIKIWDNEGELQPRDLPTRNTAHDEYVCPEGPSLKMARVANRKGTSPRIPIWEHEVRSGEYEADVRRESRLQPEGRSFGRNPGLKPQDTPLRESGGNKSFRNPRTPVWEHEHEDSPRQGAAWSHDFGAESRGKSGDTCEFKPPSPPPSRIRGDKVPPGPSEPYGDHEQPETPLSNKRPKRGAPTTSDSDVQSIIKYILKNGGPSRILAMTIDERVEGWHHLADLKRCLKKQQRRGGVSTLPKWYCEFLTEFGYPNPYKKVRLEEHQPPDEAALPNAPRQLSALHMRSPLEVLEGSWEPTKPTDVGKKPKSMRDLTTSDPQVHIACRYIMEHGGPGCIEKLPLPDKSVSGESNVLLFSIQRCMQKHRTSEGTPVWYKFPRWYKQFLTEHGFPIAKWTGSKTEVDKSGPEDGKSGTEADKSGSEAGKSGSEAGKSGQEAGKSGPEAGKSGPEAGKSGPEARRGPRPYPQQEHPTYRPEVQTLVNYIMDNGGPENVDTLTIASTLEKSCRTMLSVLQQIIKNSRKNCRNQLVLPRWFAQFLVDYGLSAPVDAFSAADEDPSTSEDILKDPKQLKEYISQQGGHLNIEMIPVNTAIPGWKMLFGLQTAIREMKKKGITFYKGGVRAYPPWYHAYLAEYEPDHYMPIPGIDAIEPVKEGSSQKLQPSKDVAQMLSDHIMEHGGPSAIETMPLPEKHHSHISKLQACIVNQKYKANGKVVNLPSWYKKFLVDQGYDLRELYPHLNVADHYLHPDEQFADHEQPEFIWEPALPVHSAKPAVDEPSSESKHQKELTKKGQRWAYNYIDLVNYILENGGPDNMENMDISTAPIIEPCKAKLTSVQQMIVRMKNGESVSLPGWYIHFLEEYGFPTPIVVKKESADNTDRVRHVDLTDLKKYILKNGGHSKIETMPIDSSVAHSKWLKRLRASLRGQIKRGGVHYYPNWYWDYLAECEPDVKIPDHVTRKDSELPAENENGNTAGQDQDMDKPWRSPPRPPGVAKGTVPNPPGWKEPSAHVTRQLGAYIMSRGGPSEIENMPLPPVGYLGRSNLAKLQKTLKLQREGDPLHQWLPIWYKKFLRDGEFDAKELYPHLTDEQLAIPPDKDEPDKTANQPDSNSSQQKPSPLLAGPAIGVSRPPEDILVDPKVQSAMKYIEDHGGPERIASMPAPARDSGVEGWQLVCRLQNGFINRSSNEHLSMMPVWYILFLMRRGDPIPTNQYVDKFGRTHLSVDSLGKPLEILDPPPFDFSTFDPETYGRVVPPPLADYIKQHGGHANIEKIPIDFGVPGYRLLQKLQKNIIKQKKSKSGMVWRYPPWYRVYLAEYEPELELPNPVAGEQANSASADPVSQWGTANKSAESESQRKTSPPAESSPQKKIAKSYDSTPQSKTSKHADSGPEEVTTKSADSKPQSKTVSSADSDSQKATTKSSDSKPRSKTVSSADSGPEKVTSKSADSKPQSKTVSSTDSDSQKATTKSSDSKPRSKTVSSSDSGPEEVTSKSADSKPRSKTVSSADSGPQKVASKSAYSLPEKVTTKSTDHKPQAKTAAPTDSGRHKKATESADSEPQWKVALRKLPRCQVVLVDFKRDGYSKSTNYKSTGSVSPPKTPTESESQKKAEPKSAGYGVSKKRTKSTDSKPQQKSTSESERRDITAGTAETKPVKVTTPFAESETRKKRTKSTNSGQQQRTSTSAEPETRKNKSKTTDETQQKTATPAEPETRKKKTKSTGPQQKTSAAAESKLQKKGAKSTDSEPHQKTAPSSGLAESEMEKERNESTDSEPHKDITATAGSEVKKEKTE